MGYSRQIAIMACGKYIPILVTKINKRFRTPHFVIIAGEKD